MSRLGRVWHPVRDWWRRVIKPTAAWRALVRLESDTMTDSAATLSYYAMLSLFPGLLLAMTIIGLVGGEGLVSDIVSFARDQGADSATATVVETVARSATRISSGALTVSLVLSTVLLINSASGIFHAAGRAVNRAHDVEEDRGFVRRRIVVVVLTLIVVLLLVVSMIAIFLGGKIATDVFSRIGLGSEAQDVWSIVRWPVALGLALAAVSIVLRYAPAEAAQRRHLVTSGSIVTVVLWVIASAGFSVYVQGFGRYGALYGVFSTAVILLLWAYLMALAFLYGAELDGELRRRRAARDERQEAPGVT